MVNITYLSIEEILARRSPELAHTWLEFHARKFVFYRYWELEYSTRGMAEVFRNGYARLKAAELVDTDGEEYILNAVPTSSIVV
jgi:hypothetical protein